MKPLLGKILVVCAVLLAVPTGGWAKPPDMAPPAVFALAKSAVGFSYWWGHGRWQAGTAPGSCSGNCPTCTHTGTVGADCSGFLAKVWQVPAASPVDKDAHPYSTMDFQCKTTHWLPVAKDQAQPADAMVYRKGGCPGTAGHIFLYEKSDPWGWAWAYECKGCAAGCVYNLREVGAEYAVRRRVGLGGASADPSPDAGFTDSSNAAKPDAGRSGKASVDGGDLRPDAGQAIPDRPIADGGAPVPIEEQDGSGQSPSGVQGLQASAADDGCRARPSGTRDWPSGMAWPLLLGAAALCSTRRRKAT